MPNQPSPEAMSRPEPTPSGVVPRCQRGSILIAIIIALTVVAGLGTAIYSFTSTASRTQIAKAYYLAESGGHYAIKRLMGIDSTKDTERNALLAELAAEPYTVADAGQFRLSGFTYIPVSGFDEYRFSSKGKPGDASISRQISYIVKLPSASGVKIPFDGSGSTLNADNWNVVGNAELKNNEQIVKLNKGSADNQVSLDWDRANSIMPNLLDVWRDAKGLLTYEAQVKVRLGNGHDVMAGISFRLNTQGDNNVTNDSFYGISYLWCKDHNDLPAFCSDAPALTTYVVLWRQAADGVRTVIGKQLASMVAPSLVNSGQLVDWATLVVRVQEQINPASGERENLIFAFAGSPVNTPKGTIH